MFTRQGVPVAGGMGDMGDMPANNTWKIYLNTLDINDTVSRGEELGASFVFPPMPGGDMGIQTVFTDATGAALGAWQPLSFSGFTTWEEHGTPCWFELNARDFEGAVDFYRDVFGLRTKVMSDSPEFRNTSLVADGAEVAGIVDASGLLSGGAASYWVVYWQVNDIDSALARVRELGGTVHDGPLDSPFGRIATVADTSGSVFKLRGSPSVERPRDPA